MTGRSAILSEAKNLRDCGAFSEARARDLAPRNARGVVVVGLFFSCHCERHARQGLGGGSVAISILISSTGIASSPRFIGAPCNDRKVRRLGFELYHLSLKCNSWSLISEFVWSRFTAEGGTRTHTPLQEADFKSAASTIPPPRHSVHCKLHRGLSQNQYLSFCARFL